VDDDRSLTVQEIAELLRVNPETVRRWLRQKRLRGTMLGGDRAGYRIAESELRRFIAGDQGKARAA
jgi:excisionase family DNA binding protein